MSIEKQTKKVSNKRQEYLKFKPFADDLRKAESWCELDGVLNRYQTVKNLHKMGYRKASEVAREIFEEIEKQLKKNELRNYEPYNVESYYSGDLEKDLAKLKKKYTEEGK